MSFTRYNTMDKPSILLKHTPREPEAVGEWVVRVATVLRDLCLAIINADSSYPPRPRPPPEPLVATFPTEITELIFEQLYLDFLSAPLVEVSANHATARALCLTSREMLGYGRSLLHSRLSVEFTCARCAPRGLMPIKKMCELLVEWPELPLGVRKVDIAIGGGHVFAKQFEHIILRCIWLEEIIFHTYSTPVVCIPRRVAPAPDGRPLQPIPRVSALLLGQRRPPTSYVDFFAGLHWDNADPVDHYTISHYDTLLEGSLTSPHRAGYPPKLTLVDCGGKLIRDLLEVNAERLTYLHLVITTHPTRGVSPIPIPIFPFLRRLKVTIHLDDVDACLTPAEVEEAQALLQQLVTKAQPLRSLRVDLDQTSAEVLHGDMLKQLLGCLPVGMQSVEIRQRRAAPRFSEQMEAAFVEGCKERGIATYVQRW